jgi:hypothetical protein
MSLLPRLESTLRARVCGKIVLWLGQFENYCLKGGTVAFNICLALGLKMYKIMILMKIHPKCNGNITMFVICSHFYVCLVFTIYFLLSIQGCANIQLNLDSHERLMNMLH